VQTVRARTTDPFGTDVVARIARDRTVPSSGIPEDGTGAQSTPRIIRRIQRESTSRTAPITMVTAPSAPK
jgi:hypothetical protein